MRLEEARVSGPSERLLLSVTRSTQAPVNFVPEGEDQPGILFGMSDGECVEQTIWATRAVAQYAALLGVATTAAWVAYDAGGGGGETRLSNQAEGKASVFPCGPRQFAILCGQNYLIFAIINGPSTTRPTPLEVYDLAREAEQKARDFAQCPLFCPFGEPPLNGNWRAGYAALVDEAIAQATKEKTAFWMEVGKAIADGVQNPLPGTGREPERGEALPPPGESEWPHMAPPDPLSPGYYIAAAAQVGWHCARFPEDVPPPEHTPDDPPPDPDGGTPTPPDPGSEPPEEEQSQPPLELGPLLAECKTKDEDGKAARKCCYMNTASGKCMNYGCWHKGTNCYPNADKTDCECKHSPLITEQTLEPVNHSDSLSGLGGDLAIGASPLPAIATAVAFSPPRATSGLGGVAGPDSRGAPSVPAGSPVASHFGDLRADFGHRVS
jgi:hypothetical protein